MRFPRRELRPETPIVPMANVAFLMIVCFLIANTFATVRGIDFGLAPRGRAITVDRESSLLVTIGAAGALELDGAPLDPAKLIATIAPRLAAAPETFVILRPSPEATYGDVLRVYDLLRRGRYAGVEVKHIAIPKQREIDQFWH